MMTRSRLRSCWLAFALCACLPLASRADEGQTPEDRAQSFQAVTGAQREDVAGGPLLVAAYGCVWLAVFGYVWRLSRAQARLEDEVAGLERALAKHEASKGQ